MTLSQVAQRLDSYDDELMIWARARIDLADLTPDTEAVVAPELEDAGSGGRSAGCRTCLRWTWPRRPSRFGGSGVTVPSRRPRSAARRSSTASSTTPSWRLAVTSQPLDPKTEALAPVRIRQRSSQANPTEPWWMS